MSKRLNPVTQKPFSRGDIREDGYVFHRYTDRLKADGTYVELWLAPKSAEKAKKYASDNRMKNYERTSDRLPKGWKFACRSNLELETLRDLYHMAVRGRLDMEHLKTTFGYHKDIMALLTPLCKDGD